MPCVRGDAPPQLGGGWSTMDISNEISKFVWHKCLVGAPCTRGIAIASSSMGRRFCLHWSRSRETPLMVRCNRGHLHEDNVWFKCAVCRVSLCFFPRWRSCRSETQKRPQCGCNENEGDHRAPSVTECGNEGLLGVQLICVTVNTRLKRL